MAPKKNKNSNKKITIIKKEESKSQTNGTTNGATSDMTEEGRCSEKYHKYLLINQYFLPCRSTVCKAGPGGKNQC